MSKLAANPSFHPLSSFQSKLSKSFSLWLGESSGELTFGKTFGNLNPSLSWINVLRPEEGYWQFSVRAVRIGNQTLDCFNLRTTLAFDSCL